MTYKNTETLTPLERIRVRFLRCIVNDIRSFIVPGLTSGDALERAQYIAMVLSRFADDSDVTSTALPLMAGAFEMQLAQSIQLLTSAAPSEAVTKLSSDKPKHTDTILSADERVFALRSQLSLCIRLLSEIDNANPHWADAQRQLNSIANVEYRWLDVKESVEKRPALASTPKAVSVYQRITPEAVTDYLRRQFPESPNITAYAVEVLAGGRSKKTAFLTISEAQAWPQTVVLRQDSGMTHMGTNVASEMGIINAVKNANLPIPKILHFEPNETTLGPSFLLMEKLPGKPAGSFFSFSVVDKALLAEVAQTLARLHQLDPRQLGLPAGDTYNENERLKESITRHWQKWREGAVEPSPVMEYAFNWLLRMCEGPLRGNAIVHGDYRPQNLLTESGRLTGILDWEFAHLGNPAEDLAYLRSTVTPVMEWSEFLRYYEAAGGDRYDETIVRIYDIWWMLRLGALAGGAVEGLLDGTTDDLPQGAGGYVVVPMFEKRLTSLLRET